MDQVSASNKPLILPLIAVFLILSMIIISFSLRRYKGVPEKTETKTVTTVTPIVAKIKLSCPVPQEFCKQGKAINEGVDFSGIAFTLPLETPLLAVFPGHLLDEPKIPERVATQPLLYLRSSEGYEIVYSFFGTKSALNSKNYSLGEEIGKIGTGEFPPIAPFGGANFLISLRKDGKFIPLSLEDFNQ